MAQLTGSLNYDSGSYLCKRYGLVKSTGTLRLSIQTVKIVRNIRIPRCRNYLESQEWKLHEFADAFLRGLFYCGVFAYKWSGKCYSQTIGLVKSIVNFTNPVMIL